MDTPRGPRLGLIPTFSQPPPPNPDHNPPDQPPPPDLYSEPPTQRPDRNATPTPTSSPGSKPSTQDAAALLIGLLGLAVVGAGLLVRWRTRNNRRLRAPTDKQLRQMAEPLAAIGLRHFDSDLFNRDVADLTRAGAALGAYITDGPLTQPNTDPGLPDLTDQENQP
jgi:hypothetical protein